MANWDLFMSGSEYLIPFEAPGRTHRCRLLPEFILSACLNRNSSGTDQDLVKYYQGWFNNILNKKIKR